MGDFDHILNWTLKRGSHEFPGPDGGTCINEAAIVAAGFRYQAVHRVEAMPPCFSRPICRLALKLNDEASDEQRQRLMPFVTRLACSDSIEIEAERAAYIEAWASGACRLEQGLAVLEGAIALGRQAEPVDRAKITARLEAARDGDGGAITNPLAILLKAWARSKRKQPEPA